MKKTLVVAALTGVFATAANAQSSVTLYGLIDAGVTYTNNVRTTAGNSGHRYALQSGGINGSRWGLRGAEDLGGGLKAIFQLENGFSIANGAFAQQGREFGRQAFVGLSSSQWGTATLGRQYDSLVDFMGPLSLTGTGYGGTFAAHPYDNDNLDNSFRISNSVKFSSANYNGLKFGGLYGFSNNANGFETNRAFSGGVSYSYAGFNFAGAYLQLNNSLNSATTALGTTGAVTDATIAAAKQRTFGGGVNYAFGPAVVGFVFTQSKFDNAGSYSPNGTATALPAGAYLRFNNYEVNARYNVTPAWNLSAQYTYTQARESGFAAGDESPKYHTASLMSSYSLSKRTDVYVEGVYARVNGTSNLGGATINGLGQSSTNKQVAATVGVRHRF
ncbi:porin [Robbsia sp. Bb-Pol-6]|uniref:Porin n=1 Tax=Robbsia betulipollinis TaxID=2981849 RepID=A0ABT3ZQ45_9BURK|nr:porin [Robbsia betulipollinis]MCY0388669.1 porin [Robbsia betulipollinis]